MDFSKYFWRSLTAIIIMKENGFNISRGFLDIFAPSSLHSFNCRGMIRPILDIIFRLQPNDEHAQTISNIRTYCVWHDYDVLLKADLREEATKCVLTALAANFHIKMHIPYGQSIAISDSKTFGKPSKTSNYYRRCSEWPLHIFILCAWHSWACDHSSASCETVIK